MYRLKITDSNLNYCFTVHFDKYRTISPTNALFIKNIKCYNCLKSLYGSYMFRSLWTIISPDKWVPVTTAWRVLRLQMEEQPPIWRVAVNILNKQSWTADEGWSSSLGVGRGANA